MQNKLKDKHFLNKNFGNVHISKTNPLPWYKLRIVSMCTYKLTDTHIYIKCLKLMQNHVQIKIHRLVYRGQKLFTIVRNADNFKATDSGLQFLPMPQI